MNKDKITYISNRINETDTEIVSLTNEINTLKSSLSNIHHKQNQQNVPYKKQFYDKKIYQNRPEYKTHQQYQYYNDGRRDNYIQNISTINKNQKSSDIPLESLKVDYLAELCRKHNIPTSYINYKKNEFILLLNKNGIYYA